MTRKHFVKLAEVLRKLKPERVDTEIQIGQYNMWEDCVEETATMCKQLNSRFDRDRFMIACEYLEE